MRLPKRLEFAIERRLVKLLKEVHPKIRILKLTPAGNAGYQDRLILLPGAVTIFVELKRPDATLRKLQGHRRKEVARLGFMTLTIDSDKKVDNFVSLVRRIIG